MIPKPNVVSLSFSAWIFDVTRSYHLAFIISGGFFAFAGSPASLIQLIASRTTNSSLVFDSTTKDHDTEAMVINAVDYPKDISDSIEL